MSAATQLRWNTLLRDVGDPQAPDDDPGDYGVLSLRHRVLAAANEADIDVDAASAEIEAQIADGILVPVEGVQPDIPTCRECGCTEHFACEDRTGAPCRWVIATSSTNLLLCTACAASSAS